MFCLVSHSGDLIVSSGLACTPAPYQPGVMVHACDHSTEGGGGGKRINHQGHPWLHGPGQLVTKLDCINLLVSVRDGWRT